MKVANDPKVPSASAHKKAQLNIIKQHEREIEQLRNNYERQVDETRTLGQEQLQRERAKNKGVLDVTGLNHKARLEEMSKILNETQKKLDEEVEQLRINKEQRIQAFSETEKQSLKSMIEELKSKVQEEEDNAHETLIDTRSHYDHLKENARHRGQVAVKEISDEKQHQANDMRQYYQNRINSEQNQFNTKLLQQKTEQNQISKANEADALRKQRNMETEKNKTLQFQQSQFKNQIESNYKNFLEKYQQIQEQHKQLYANLDQQIDQNMDKIRYKNAHIYAPFAQKSENPFYQMTLLNPQVSEQEKQFIITMPIPEYEKDFVQISGKGKNLRIGHSRDYSEKLADTEQNRQHFISKTESYSQTLKLPEAVNLNKIQKNYRDGVLTFILPKD